MYRCLPYVFMLVSLRSSADLCILLNNFFMGQLNYFCYKTYIQQAHLWQFSNFVCIKFNRFIVEHLVNIPLENLVTNYMW